MRLHVIGSGSSGNCCILESIREALIIDCGMPLIDAKKAIGFQIDKVAGCLVGHGHLDHIGYINQYLDAAISVYTSRGTIDAAKIKGTRKPIAIKAKQTVQVGGFKIMPFDIKHDAPEPLGFLIYHPECGKILFVTDTYYVPYKFNGLNHVIIESNYDEEVLEQNICYGNSNMIVRNRVLESHMSLQTVIKTLVGWDLSELINIILIHLSAVNSGQEMKRKIQESTGKNTYIAEKGMTIDLNAQPF